MNSDTDVEALAKTHELVLAGPMPEGKSTQPKDAQAEGLSEAMFGDLIEPPLELEKLSRLSQTSSTRRAIIDAIARNTVGLGYAIEAGEGHQEKANEDDFVRTRNSLEALARRDPRLEKPSLTELLYAVKTDEEEVGQGFMEVSRSRLTGKIDGLFHLPAKRMRRLKTRDGYALLPAGGMEERKTYFYPFGEKVEYTNDGDPLPKLRRNGLRWARNEVIVFRLYTSESRDYGMPRDAAMLLDYAGDKLASESNVSFFDSSGVPPSIIFVRGEEASEGGRINFKVPPQTVHQIAQLLKSDAGHHHRVALIPLPPGSKVDHVELGKFSERDVGFTEFRKENRRIALASYRMSPIFLSDVDDSGRYTAEVQRAITLEQVFDPEQQRYEQRVRDTLLNDLGVGHLQLKFKKLAVESDAARRDSADKLAESGAITNGELRAAHGHPPLPEADEGKEPEHDEVPFGWNSELVDAGRPAGAENRTSDGDDQRGLRPGTAGRKQRSTDEELEAQRQKVEKSEGDPAVEEEVTKLEEDLNHWLDDSVAAGLESHSPDGN